MKAELYKRLFRAIFSEDVSSLKKIAITIIQEERKLGHNILADSLEKISITEKPKYTLFESRKSESGLSALPKSKRTNSQLVSYIPREQLKHHMILPNEVEERLLSIEQEYVARERLKKFNLVPKRKILLYGSPGCGKTLSAERIAWNLGLPLLKVRFDSLLSSYFELPKRPDRKDGEADEHYSIREQRWTERFNAAYMVWDEIKMQREETIESFVSDYNGEIMELADGTSEIADLPDSFSARLRISGKCLFDLVLNFAYIFEVSEAETIAM